MGRLILILEDDSERRKRFTAITQQMGIHIRFWHSAHKMIAEFPGAISNAALISLDCDLIPSDGSDAWGDGIIVAESLAKLRPTAPVIVHSSNYNGSQQMMSLLREAKWTVSRVAPIGDDWIERDWRMEVERLLKAQSNRLERENH